MGAEAVASFWEAAEAPDGARSYAEKLTALTQEHQADIDKTIATCADNWTVDRMGRVDRNVLRLAVAELFHIDDVPSRVTMDEAVEIAKRFGGEDSSRFVNGVLDRVVREAAERIIEPPSVGTKAS